ncbi:CPBP family glutamic-type intramembrane protease [Streptomyces sp. 1331.2]|uniref:CPBP family glutamic-type intramembrane protease n=1 Tax=Streptomyces sp. 1331.2 TaxID=1938835 RepID=UPI000BD786B9|nr:CPBP family glutamic-type intramembrane protease [Streptomyces sp. 1331.2]SOB81334.1 hypothetical protein SAMN06272789_1461 [Streptomyces sp. 1331.2]
MSTLLEPLLRGAVALAVLGVGGRYGVRALNVRLVAVVGGEVISQVATWCVVLGLLLPLWWPARTGIGSGASTIVLVPLGAAVGAGELAVAGLLSTMVASAVRRESVGSHNWMAVLHSTAVRPYRRLAQRLPWPAAAGVFLLVGLAQELLLRGAVFGLARGGGAGLAVALSACCSLLAAVLPVRDRDGRYLAGVVGVVTGVVHGLLYAHTHSLIPLAVAQGTFLALAVL